MSSQDIIKSVSKKLKYYIEVKRLEDGFDLSRADHTRLNHIPIKSHSAMPYDGVSDIPVSHYFREQSARVMLTTFKTSHEDAARQSEIKRSLQRYMRRYRFVPDPIRGDPKDMKTRDKAKLSKKDADKGGRLLHRRHKLSNHGGYPVAYGAPSTKVTRSEAKRLLNIASKLLLATESIEQKDDPPSRPRSHTPRRLSEADSSHTRKSSQDRTRARSAEQRSRTYSEDSQHKQTAPKPFESNKKLPDVDDEEDVHVTKKSNTAKQDSNNRGRKTKKDADVKKHDTHDSAYSTPRDSSSSPATRDMERRQNKPEQKKQLASSPRDRNQQPAKKSAARPKTSVGPRPPNDHRPPHHRPIRYIGNDTGNDWKKGGTNEGKKSSGEIGTQTGGSLLRDYDASEEVLSDGPVKRYLVAVKTGGKNGASTRADIRLVLVGEDGRTRHLPLTESKTHKVKFLQNQEDRFEITCPDVGKLKRILIGHDRKELEYGWYLEKVTVRDRQDSIEYVVPCDRWLSAPVGDGLTFCRFDVHSSMTYTSESAYNPEDLYHSVVKTEPKMPSTESSGDGKNFVNPATGSRTSMENQGSRRSSDDSQTQWPKTGEDKYADDWSASGEDSQPESDHHDNDRKPNRKEPTPQTVSVQSTPEKRKDDFFDQRTGGTDYGNILETIMSSTDAEKKVPTATLR